MLQLDNYLDKSETRRKLDKSETRRKLSSSSLVGFHIFIMNDRHFGVGSWNLGPDAPSDARQQH